MNEYHKAMMDAPSFTPFHCVICGEYPSTRHHVVPRSQGGADGPQVSLCGHGTAGHHRAAEDKRLHLFWDGSKWLYLETKQPTKYERALCMEGWKAMSR